MKNLEIKNNKPDEFNDNKADEIFTEFVMQIESLNPLAEWTSKNELTEKLHNRIKISNSPKNLAH